MVPPSTWMVVPVTKRDSSDARYTTAAAQSSVVPQPNGILAS